LYFRALTLPISYKIIICEDHDVVVEGVKLMLAHQRQFMVCGHARNQQELVQLLEKEQPEVLLLDLNLNGQDGFAILELIRPKYPQLKVIIFTMYEEGFMIEKARKLKANGYLLKNSSGHELQEALNHVMQSNEFYLPQALFKQKRENDTYRDEFIEKMHLTVREIEIIKLITEGKSSKEIADQLFLSIHTVDTHRRNVLVKLKMKNIADLVRFAAKNNLIG
jgi:two-component system nitrate/nitrite response regulator NarL